MASLLEDAKRIEDMKLNPYQELSLNLQAVYDDYVRNCQAKNEPVEYANVGEMLSFAMMKLGRH